MEILIKRIYMKEDCTVGCLQILHRGYLCDTLEPHAIAWENKPLIGQKAGKLVKGKTAIPEGRYRVEIRYSKTYKRMLPFFIDVPQFKSVVLRAGKRAKLSRGDIIIGHLIPPGIGHPADNPLLADSRRILTALIEQIAEATNRGEEIWLTIRSPKGWTKSVHI